MVLLNIAVLYIIYRYMHCFFDTAQVKKIKELTAYGLYFIMGCLTDQITGMLVIRFVVRVVLLILLVQIYTGKQGKKLLAVFLVQGMNLFCEASAVYILYDCRVDGEYGIEMAYIIFLFMYVCERVIEKFGIKNLREDTSLRHWDLLIFLPVISVVVLFVLITSDIGSQYVGASVSVGMILLNLVVFYICDEMVGAYIRLEEGAFVEQQLESYSNQINVIMRSEETVRGLRHDLKNHLSEILMMAEGNRTREIRDYVRNMQQDMTNEKEHVSSGNADIDSLLNLKLEQAKSELGNVRCRVSVPHELDIPAFDWNIILGNLLDNAIRAAKESEEKLLQIRIAYQRGMLLIRVRNSYSGGLVKTGDSYRSTKEYDRTDQTQLHGLGIRNVKRIVEKYQGNMEISDGDGMFDVRILMYVSVRKDF